MKAKAISAVMYNPLWMSRLLRFLLSGAWESQQRPIKIDILHLALPILCDANAVSKLEASSIASSFETVFASVEMQAILINIFKNSLYLHEHINKALICIGDELQIDDQGFVCLLNPSHYKHSEKSIRRFDKAAYNLGAILSKENHINILLKIGAAS